VTCECWGVLFGLGARWDGGEGRTTHSASYVRSNAAHACSQPRCGVDRCGRKCEVRDALRSTLDALIHELKVALFRAGTQTTPKTTPKTTPTSQQGWTHAATINWFTRDHDLHLTPCWSVASIIVPFCIAVALRSDVRIRVYFPVAIALTVTITTTSLKNNLHAQLLQSRPYLLPPLQIPPELLVRSTRLF
jgi:hypothetical protein